MGAAQFLDISVVDVYSGFQFLSEIFTLIGVEDGPDSNFKRIIQSKLKKREQF